MSEKKTMVFCEMHRKEMPSSVVWSYEAKLAKDNDRAECNQFCSYECMMAFLLDDEKVLKMKLRRMKVDRAIRHPHSISRAPFKILGDPRFDEYHYILKTDGGFGEEKVEVLPETNEMNEKHLKQEFDKEELEALYAAYSD